MYKYVDLIKTQGLRGAFFERMLFVTGSTVSME